jgi:hypothetical protein
MKATAPKRRTCKCNLCLTGRRFKRNVAKLPKKEREWMLGVYDSAFDAWAELEMIRASN